MSRTTALDRAREAMEGREASAERGAGQVGPAPVVEALPKEARRLVVRPEVPSRNPTMLCPCGSTKSADMMIDVQAEGLGAVFDEPWVCTTCVRHQRRLGHLPGREEVD